MQRSSYWTPFAISTLAKELPAGGLNEVGIFQALKKRSANAAERHRSAAASGWRGWFGTGQLGAALAQAGRYSPSKDRTSSLTRRTSRQSVQCHSTAKPAIEAN